MRQTLWLLPPLCVLQARPNSIAVFVPSEITTYCFYPGLQRDYMVSTTAVQPSLANHPSTAAWQGPMRSKETAVCLQQKLISEMDDQMLWCHQPRKCKWTAPV